MKNIVIAILEEKSGHADILPEYHLYNNLGLNSIDIAEIIVELEITLHVVIPDEKIENLCYVNDLIKLAETFEKKARPMQKSLS
jgi:acyl carrier protein